MVKEGRTSWLKISHIFSTLVCYSFCWLLQGEIKWLNLYTHLKIHVLAVNILQAFARFLCDPGRSLLCTAGAKVDLLFWYNFPLALLMCCCLEELGAFFQYNGMLSSCSFHLGLFLLHYQVQSQGSRHRVYLLRGEDVLLLVYPPTKCK